MKRVLLCAFALLSFFEVYSQVLSNGFFKANVISASNNLKSIEGITWDKNGRGYIWDKKGYVFLLDQNDQLMPDTLIDISQEIGLVGDNGLNGFALDPNFLTNGYFYLAYSVDRYFYEYSDSLNYNPDSTWNDTATFGRITRYTADATNDFKSTIYSSRYILLGDSMQDGFPVVYFSHSNGAIQFGTDGSLMCSMADAASYGSDPDTGSHSDTWWQQALIDGTITPGQNVGCYKAQMLSTLAGKILRIDPANGNGLNTNPFWDGNKPKSPQSRIWSIGFRNPFRFQVIPNTGDTDITAGNPGYLIVGDVGWGDWEEISLVKTKGLNCGWPVFEGMTATVKLKNAQVENVEAPNSYYPGCGAPYYKFNDLVDQEYNIPHVLKDPCDTNSILPYQWKHTRPLIEWHHKNVNYPANARAPIFSNQTGKGIPIDIDNPNSPIQGAMYPGNAAMGGFYLNSLLVPLEFRNSIWFGDYGEGWIRYLKVNSNFVPDSVVLFDSAAENLVDLKFNEHNGCIYFISYPNEVYKYCFPGFINNPPYAVPTANINYGPTGTTINFDGTASFDPENSPLAYDWDFDDNGAIASGALVSHTFSPGNVGPVTYDVKLCVSDTQGLIGCKIFKIFINNTPPAVNITSPSPAQLCSGQSLLNLTAQVSDAQSPNNALSYYWYVHKEHNLHFHPEEQCDSYDSTDYCIVDCENCLYNDGDTVWFSVYLCVQDPQGMETCDVVNIAPACAQSMEQFLAQANAEILVYPNPMQGNQLFVRLNNANLKNAPRLYAEIYSVDGKKLNNYDYILSVQKNNIVQIDFKNPLAKGMYYIRLSDGKKMSSAKFIR